MPLSKAKVNTAFLSQLSATVLGFYLGLAVYYWDIEKKSHPITIEKISIAGLLGAFIGFNFSLANNTLSKGNNSKQSVDTNFDQQIKTQINDNQKLAMIPNKNIHFISKL